MMVSLYGEMVRTDSEAWRAACEARVLLQYPLEKRRTWIDTFVKARGRGDGTVEYLARVDLQNALTKEWEWQRAQRAAAVPA